MSKKQQAAVRSYLVALRDPATLRDDDAIAELRTAITQSDDELERLRLRQQMLDLEQPTVEQYEDAFVEHAKAWADSVGVTGEAFAAEGVPTAVLRRAGFRIANGRSGPRRRRPAEPPADRRRRVSADEVRAAIPSGVFTVRDVQDRSGASAVVVRRVIGEEVEAGRVTNEGPDLRHEGPGRAPIVYRRP